MAAAGGGVPLTVGGTRRWRVVYRVPTPPPAAPAVGECHPGCQHRVRRLQHLVEVGSNRVAPFGLGHIEVAWQALAALFAFRVNDRVDNADQGNAPTCTRPEQS